MKKQIILIIIALLIVGAIFIFNQSFEQKSPEQKLCEEQGGTWRQFSNGCVDICGKENIFCTQVLTLGCDCGENKCWDENSCIPN